MKVAILLPYKENFSPEYPGAVSLFVNETSKISRYKKDIVVFGNTNYKKRYNLKKRIDLHNNNKGAKFTRGRKWKLIYKEKTNSKKEAISREYYIKKNRKLRNKIKNEHFNSSTL